MAERVVGQETVRKGVSAETASDLRVCERLREPLSSLAGKTGFQALLCRAVALTKAEFPELGPAKVTAEGRFDGMAEILRGLSPQEVIRIEVALVSHIVELLCTFLGEGLTVRLLQDVWPDASFNDSNSRKETTA